MKPAVAGMPARLSIDSDIVSAMIGRLPPSPYSARMSSPNAVSRSRRITTANAAMFANR